MPVFVFADDNQKYNEEVLKEFSGKEEFDISIVPVNKNEVIGLASCVDRAIAHEDDFFVISRNTHRFAGKYDRRFLIESILRAHDMRSDLFLGGFQDFNNAVRIAQNMYWIDHCASPSFFVVYKKFYAKIMENAKAPQNRHDALDLFLARMTVQKTVAFPFISRNVDSNVFSDALNGSELPSPRDMINAADLKFGMYERVVSRYAGVQ